MIKVSGKERAWREGMTIADLLNDIEDDHPYAVVRIDSTYVSRPNFDKTIIPDGAEVFLVPMIAGGCATLQLTPAEHARQGERPCMS